MNALLAALLLVALVVLLGVLGAAWEAWQAAAERRRIGMPGRLVATHDGLLHAHLQGRRNGIAQPVIVLDGGLCHGSLTWPGVVRELGPDWLMLRFDRAGHLWSDSGAGRRDAEANLADQRALLAALHLAPPWLLVAHGYSGHIARLHAMRHPEDVAGLVLVAATPPPLARTIADSPFARSLRWKVPAARFGLWRLIRMSRGLPAMSRGEAPEDLAASADRLSQSARDLAASRAELADFAADMEALQGEEQPGQPCILVASAHAAPADVLDAQRAMAARLPCGEYRATDAAGHALPWQAPAEVARAIRDVAARCAASADRPST